MPNKNMQIPEHGIPEYAVRDLFRACQLAYRKYHCGDESISQGEVSEALYVAISNSVGDTKFAEWVNNPNQ